METEIYEDYQKYVSRVLKTQGLEYDLDGYDYGGETLDYDDLVDRLVSDGLLISFPLFRELVVHVQSGLLLYTIRK